jgi:hypothetical protein
VYALYGSYQMRLNERWGALAGLRAEYTDMDINQITGGVKASNNYINYIPSLFATYKAPTTPTSASPMRAASAVRTPTT